MSKNFAIVLAVLVVLFGGLLIFNKSNNSDSASGNGNTENVQPSNHIQGDESAPVTLTEWGDFECPACGQYYALVKQVKQEYGDEIAFRFRHFPLISIHQNAIISARAAEAAGMQGKFFEMHDLLYENQDQWSQSTSPTQIFEDYARQLDLDVAQFSKDIKSNTTNRIVQADLAEANKRGYSSTPTFEINGEKIENPRSLEDFQEVIDQALKEAGADGQQNNSEGSQDSSGQNDQQSN